MRSAYLDDSRAGRRAVFGRRGRGFLLALAVEALLILLLFFLAPRVVPGGSKEEGGLKTFNFAPSSQSKQSKQSPTRERRAETKPVKTPPPSAPPVPIVPMGQIPGLITLSREEYAASDIGKIKSAKSDLADSGSDPGDSDVAGLGPNGEPLYNAEWYREPRDAETGPYIPKGLRAGVALIACKTAANFRVEDCIVLGDSPPGSGLARGIREAAWQFRVRPPRKGGKSLIGAWVRIRFELVARGQG